MFDPEIRQNPFMDRGRWYWRDANQLAHGPYLSQIEALRGLMRHLDTRSRWLRLKDLWQEFVR